MCFGFPTSPVPKEMVNLKAKLELWQGLVGAIRVNTIWVYMLRVNPVNCVKFEQWNKQVSLDLVLNQAVKFLLSALY
jgi:hypothetical protein